MSAERVQGVVLKTLDFKDNDRIVTILTDKLGKIDVVAHGVRSAKSRISSAVQPFCYGKYLVYSGQSLYTLNQAEIVESFQEIIMNLDNIYYGVYYLELFDILTEKEAKNVSMLALLLKTLYIMTGSDISKELLRLTVDFKAVSISGYLPSIERCTKCRRKITAGYFSNADGGMICRECTKEAGLPYVDENVHALLKYLKNIKLEELDNTKFDRKTIAFVQKMMTDYICYHTEREFKTIAVINQMK